MYFREARVVSIIWDDGASTFISTSGPGVLFCSVNEAEMLALRTGLREANHLYLRQVMVKGDSLCVIIGHQILVSMASGRRGERGGGSSSSS